MKTPRLILSALWVSFCTGTAVATVGLDPSTVRSLPPQFYGVNGQSRNSVDWNSFESPLNEMDYGILRLPGGTGSNYWNWHIGDFLNAPNPTNNTDQSITVGYWDGYTTDSAYPSTDSEFIQEIKNTGATPLLTMNVLTDPDTANVGSQRDRNGYNDFNPDPSLYGNPAYSTDAPGPGPDLTDQEQWLSDMDSQLQDASLGLVQYVELGNEYYLTFPGYELVYPTDYDGTDNNGGAAYADVANSWITAIHHLYPGVKVDVVGGDLPASTDPRKENWNSRMFNILSDEDAVTLHLYPNANLTDGVTPAILDSDTTDVDSMLAGPFNLWSDMETYDLPSIPTDVAIWITEYNLRDDKSSVYGTWNHGLYVGLMSLLFLSSPQIQMALHHCAIGNAFYSDLFSSTDGFVLSQPGTPPTAPGTDPNYYPTLTAGNGGTDAPTLPATTVGGQSAEAIVQSEINAAAEGQSMAEELTFTDAPTITANNLGGGQTTYCCLYGWCFYGTDDGPTGGQTIILNLSDAIQTLNLGVVVSTDGATYDQISQKPGFQVTEGIDTPDFAGSDGASVIGGQLTATGAKSFEVPPYSLTRISNPGFIMEVAQGLENGPQGTDAPPYTVEVQSVGGWKGTVALTAVIANGSSEWTTDFSPASIVDPPAQDSPIIQPAPTTDQGWAASTLTIGVGAHATTGNTHTITVTGTSGTTVNTATCRVAVVPKE